MILAEEYAESVRTRKPATRLSCRTVPMTAGYWDFGGEREPLMHRIHAYPAKFPAFITPKAVSYAQARGVTVNRIADIFCGCGTTALEAKRLGTPFWGCDINPVATLIAQVKSEDYQPARLQNHAERVLRSFDRRRPPRHPRQQDDDRLRYWYDDDRIRSLARLKAAIESLPEGKYRNFFLCAFSNILKPTSRWLTKSIKPQVDPDKDAADVRSAFDTQVVFMIKAAQEVRHHTASERRILTGNFLEMEIAEPFADLIITSPPYVTSYEYADLHQLSTLWLDYTDDYRKLRHGTIGSLYHDSNFMRDVKQLNAAGSAIVFRLYDAEHRKASATARYFVDMHRAVKQCRKVLRPGGMVLFVIGNTEYKGVKIDNAAYLHDCLIQEAFTEIETIRRKVSAKNLTPYRDTLGRFSTDSASRQVYAEEFIVTGRIA